MFPFVDPGWYEKYWYSDQPHPKRRSFSRSVTLFGVLVVLLIGGGLALSQYRSATQVAISAGNANQPVFAGGARGGPVILQ